MNVANLSLCRELWELSRWGDTGFTYCQSGSYREGYGDQSDKGWFAYDEDMAVRHHHNKWPHFVAYDLGYLMRKLPHTTKVWITDESKAVAEWNFNPSKTTPMPFKRKPKAGSWRAPDKFRADTPEDAACELAIELFKQGILTK